MENFINFFKKRRWAKSLLLSLSVLLISFPSYGESIWERGYFHYVWISVQVDRMEGEVVDLEGQI